MPGNPAMSVCANFGNGCLHSITLSARPSNVGGSSGRGLTEDEEKFIATAPKPAIIAVVSGICSRFGGVATAYRALMAAPSALPK
jgi:hypothetical protein